MTHTHAHSNENPGEPTSTIARSDYDLASSDEGVDRDWYLRRYPDLAKVADPVAHYLAHGWRERRDPRPDFSTSGYLEANAEVAGNPLIHYLRQRGTKVPPPEWQLVVDHELACSEAGVDRNWYLQTYRDVAAAGADPVTHYLQQGWREGRDPRPDFSTSRYLELNKHIEGNPFLHYLRTPQALASEVCAVTIWYRLWEKGLLYPKKGHEVPPAAAFGSAGVQKILFTGHEASRTGAPLILLRLMEAYQTLTGAELYLILDRGGPLLQDYQRIAHVLVNHNGMFYTANGPKFAEMLGTIAAPAPELAICNCADGWRLVKALREAGLPHLVSLVHERVVHYPAHAWRSLHENSDRVIFPAQAVKAATVAVLPYFQDAAVVPQGLLNPQIGRGDRTAARLNVRNELGLSPNCVIILGCGTQGTRKGVDLFVQLAARVRARTMRDVHFVWLGGEESNSLFSRFLQLDISLLNLSSAVSLLAEVTDPEPYFLAADAFALTSRDDPFPCVIHEAMACALPIVAFDGSGGAKEAIADGCGIVVPYLNVEAMADSLTSIIEHPWRCTDMRQRAESRVRSAYRFSEYAERIRGICEEITSKRAPENDSATAAPPAPSGECNQVASDGRREIPRGRKRLADFKQWFQALPAKVARTIRAGQWWEHKLVPIYAAFYATTYIHQVSIAAIWSAAVALLFAVAPCAAYVSLINDLTDCADDLRAGKTNRMAGRPRWQIALLLTAPLCIAALFSFLWRDDILLVAAYLGSWVAFSLYSIAPFRLKIRGVLGVIADACGSHVFPTLTAALLALRAIGSPIDPVWIGALGVWAFGCGLRGILWHQFYDLEADRTAAVQTFVLTHSRLTALRLARIALLIESAGLAWLLLQIRSPWPAMLLLIYGAFAMMKSWLWNVALVIAEPRDRYAILGQEYYTVLFPLGILIACALRNPIDWTIVIAHFIVFPKIAMAMLGEARLLGQATLSGGWRQRAADTTRGHKAPLTSDIAIAKAAAFLRERLRSGCYGLAAVGSDGTARFPDDKGHVFVAWPIAEAMAGLLDEIDRTIILVRILSEEQNGVWGYQSPGMLYSDETLPFLVDSDDSAFVLRTLHSLGVNREPKALLRFYRETERLFVTWDTPGPASLVTEGSLQNNFLAHPEVNANVFLALRGTHFEKYVNYDMLLQAQDQRGFWKSYFYPSPLYATLLILDLTRGNPAFVTATQRALAFIEGSQNADGSWGADSDPYETALAVAALAGHPAHTAATRRGVEHLMGTMADDGSWTSAACIWESYWTEHDLWRGYDTHRAYTSARCLIALRRAAGQLAPP